MLYDIENICCYNYKPIFLFSGPCKLPFTKENRENGKERDRWLNEKEEIKESERDREKIIWSRK